MWSRGALGISSVCRLRRHGPPHAPRLHPSKKSCCSFTLLSFFSTNKEETLNPSTIPCLPFPLILPTSSNPRVSEIPTGNRVCCVPSKVSAQRSHHRFDDLMGMLPHTTFTAAIAQQRHHILKKSAHSNIATAFRTPHGCSHFIPTSVAQHICRSDQPIKRTLPRKRISNVMHRGVVSQ